MTEISLKIAPGCKVEQLSYIVSQKPLIPAEPEINLSIPFGRVLAQGNNPKSNVTYSKTHVLVSCVIS